MGRVIRAFLIVVIALASCRGRTEDGMQPRAAQRAEAAMGVDRADDPVVGRLRPALEGDPVAESAAGPAKTLPHARTRATPSIPKHPRFLVAGGGSRPDNNQYSIEADLRLAAAKLQGPGVTLFAGGPESHGVQLRDAKRRGPSLMDTLGDLFSPRGGRRARYRQTNLHSHGPATATTVLDTLTLALAPDQRDDQALAVYIGGHGDKGKSSADTLIALWGGTALAPADIAAVLDTASSSRQVRLIMTSCYSGAFADIAFAGADPARGPARTERCGLFASTWDRPASGCDPNPNRRRHEGYGVHFLNALSRQTKSRTRLADGDIDFDADGTISLLDAHTRARIVGKGFDVPTTTSERWLRHAVASAPTDARQRPASYAAVDLPHERAVVVALSESLKLADVAEAEARFAELEAEFAALRELQLDARDEENARASAAASELLGRWPVLDDPWHPDYPLMFDDPEALQTALDDSLSYAAYLQARDAVDAIGRERDALRIESGRYLRLIRAHENLALAAELSARGGSDWATFLALRRCETSPARER